MEFQKGLVQLRKDFFIFIGGQREKVVSTCGTEKLRSTLDYPMFGLDSGSDLFKVRVKIFT